MQMNMYSSLAFPWTKGSIKRLPTVLLSVGSKLELHTLRTESLLIYFPVNSHICPRMYIKHMGYTTTVYNIMHIHSAEGYALFSTFISRSHRENEWLCQQKLFVLMRGMTS